MGNHGKEGKMSNNSPKREREGKEGKEEKGKEKWVIMVPMGNPLISKGTPMNNCAGPNTKVNNYPNWPMAPEG